MAGINPLGGSHGYIQTNRNDANVARTGNQTEAPTVGDQVNLAETRETTAPWRGTLNQTREVNEQPVFSAEWQKANLNGPGNMSEGFKTLSGAVIGARSEASANDAGHSMHEKMYLADGTSVSNDWAPSSTQGRRETPSDDGWNLST